MSSTGDQMMAMMTMITMTMKMITKTEIEDNSAQRRQPCCGGRRGENDGCSYNATLERMSWNSDLADRDMSIFESISGSEGVLKVQIEPFPVLGSCAFCASLVFINFLKPIFFLVHSATLCCVLTAPGSPAPLSTQNGSCCKLTRFKQ